MCCVPPPSFLQNNGGDKEMKKQLIRLGKRIYDVLDISVCFIKEFYLYGIFVIIETGCFFLHITEMSSNRLIAWETPFFSYTHNPIYFMIGVGVMFAFILGFKQGNRFGVF